jgi:hypothetical protein
MATTPETPKPGDNLVRILQKILCNQGGPYTPSGNETAVSICRKILLNQVNGLITLPGGGGTTQNTYFPSGWN